MSVSPTQLHEGMTVRNYQGDKIGRISSVAPDGEFHFRAGWILKDEYIASAHDVIEVRGDEAFLQLRGTIPGEHGEGRNSGSRGKHVAERTDERLI